MRPSVVAILLLAAPATAVWNADGCPVAACVSNATLADGFSCATFSNTEKFADCCCKACELSAHSEACECARHVGACAAAPEAAMTDPKFDVAGCSRDWCTSPDGYGGYDCAAPPAWGEACSCSQGSAHVVETESWEDTTLYHYTCCTSGADVELQGDSCGVQRPTVAIVVGVVLAVLVHIGSIVFMCMWLAKWKAKAAGVPTMAPMGWARGQQQPGVIDVVADSLSGTAGFSGMGRASAMPAELSPFMTPAEFEAVFTELGRRNAAELGCKCWHILLWIPMILFWPIGGFCIMLIGIERHKWHSIAIAGEVLDPACKKAGITFAVIPLQPGGKRHPGSPVMVRLILPAHAVQQAVTIQQPMQVVQPMAVVQPAQVMPTAPVATVQPVATQQQLNVVVPAGVAAGQQFAIMTPSGAQLTIVCPAGVGPGQTISVMA